MTFREVPIGAAFDVRNGATPASGETTYWDGDIPWVGPADLGKLNSRFIEKGARSITEEGYQSCGTQMVPAGSIILSIRAPIGHMALATQSMCFNQGCRGLVPRAIVHSNFAYWALSASKQRFEAAGQGTTFIELARDKLRKERIPLPDLETQRAIADFLDRETARIDQLIEKKQRLVELLYLHFAALREETLNVGYSTRLKHIANYVTSGSRDWGELYADAGELFIRIGNISGPSVDLDFSSRTYVDLTGRAEGQRTKLKKNDLLISITANLGAVSVVGADAVGGYINQHIALVRLAQPKLARFVAYSLQSKRSADEFQLKGYGGTKQGLSLNDVREVHIPLPSTDKCLKISAELDHHWSLTRSLVDKVTLSISRLREYRSALITAAVTGQTDVMAWGARRDTDRRLDLIEEAMEA